MQKHPFPSAARIRHLTEYFPETGEFIWRTRISSDFLNEISEREVKRWNSRFAEKDALGSDHQKSRYPNGLLDGHSILRHRAIWASHYGEWPTGQIDHINRNIRDNRISNLRQCTATENIRNRGIMGNNTSGVPGVHLDKHMRWVARIGENGRHKVIGRFLNFEDAVSARAMAEKELGYPLK